MSGSQCCTHLRNEFRLKHFGFSSVHIARFSHSQWRWPVGVVLLYRFLMAAYTMLWQLYSIIKLGGDIDTGSGSIPAWAFLTNWTYFVLTLYMFLHFLVCLWYVCKRGRGIFTVPVREHHRRLFHELQVEPSLWGSDRYEVVHGTGSDTEGEGGGQDAPRFAEMRWPFKIVWILFNVASAGCLAVTLIFWTMLYPQLGHMDEMGVYINLQLHGITSVLIIIEHAVTAVPVRLLHYIYTLIYGLIYVIFSVVFYELRAGHPVIYPGVLDLAHPGTTAIVLTLASLVMLPLIQLLLFAIHKAKLMIYNRCVVGDVS